MISSKQFTKNVQVVKGSAGALLIFHDFCDIRRQIMSDSALGGLQNFNRKLITCIIAITDARSFRSADFSEDWMASTLFRVNGNCTKIVLRRRESPKGDTPPPPLTHK